VVVCGATRAGSLAQWMGNRMMETRTDRKRLLFPRLTTTTCGGARACTHTSSARARAGRVWSVQLSSVSDDHRGAAQATSGRPLSASLLRLQLLQFDSGRRRRRRAHKWSGAACSACALRASPSSSFSSFSGGWHVVAGARHGRLKVGLSGGVGVVACGLAVALGGCSCCCSYLLLSDETA